MGLFFVAWVPWKIQGNQSIQGSLQSRGVAAAAADGVSEGWWTVGISDLETFLRFQSINFCSA